MSVSQREVLSSGYHIYFALGYAEHRQIKYPAIVLVPSSEEWNDFSFKTAFTYHATVSEKESFDGQILLGFRGVADDGRKKLDEALQTAPNHILSAEQAPEFYTLHRNLQAYRDVVRRFGPERAQGFLTAIHDLVFVRRVRPEPEWFRGATTSDVFTFSFMRRAETFFAFHNADPILDGIEREALGGISERLRLTFDLPTFTHPHRLDITFDSDSRLPRRMAVIIGKNGVGKSQALSNFTSSLLKDEPRLREQGGGRPKINRLLAIGSPGDVNIIFPPPRAADRIQYRRIILRRRILSPGTGFGNTLVQLARSEEAIKGKRRWQLFVDALSAVLDLKTVFIRTRPRSSSDAYAQHWVEAPIALAEMLTGDEREVLERLRSVHPDADLCRLPGSKPIPLSSGQATFARFAAEACLHIENGTMLLFDEPETHLHPNLISDFVSLLGRLLDDTGSFAILATHSAYFVREVPQSQVLVLRESRPGAVEVAPVRLKTLGANVGAISAFVFEEEPYGYWVGELARRFENAGAKGLADFKSVEHELPAEVVMHLRAVLNGGQGK